MAGKPFNPFDDQEDDLEFIPGGTEDEDPQAAQATQIKPQPQRAPAQPARAPAPPPKKAGLKLSFEELHDPGSDTRNATAIGGDALGAEDFRSGIQKKDHDAAMERARAVATAPPVKPVEKTRVAREVRTPIYLLGLGLLLLFSGVALGGYWYKGYQERQEAERLKALQKLSDPPPPAKAPAK